MSLAELLAEKGIASAVVVDDVFDVVPTAADIGVANDAWTIFNDDLSPEHRERIMAEYPRAAAAQFDELIEDNAYVGALWRLRAELGDVARLLFQGYVQDQAADQRYVDLVVDKLNVLGVVCQTAGRDFDAPAQAVDLIVIDLFFDKSQDDAAFEQSKRRLRDSIAKRKNNPPLVILMSRSPRLIAKRDEFRDEVGLLDSAFRIIQKADLDGTDKFEIQLERLADNAEDSKTLAVFFNALEQGMSEATSRTLTLFRKLSLADVGQIQQLLLNAEGEPAGSYLVDVFDRVLQHEIEREASIIDAAIPLNAFSAAQHPAPYVDGSPDLQEIVARQLSQNRERLRLPGAQDAQVTFGDILMASPNMNSVRLRATMPMDIAAATAMLVLTPACDLQRDGAPRILLLVGTVQPLGASTWAYGDDARTAAIQLGPNLRWIKWNLKHIDTVSRDQLAKAFGDQDIVVAARLREAHALELQQRLLSGLGRVGLVAPMPATFSVDVELYYAGLDGVPVRLEVPALASGAVCFVGRDEDKSPILRLVMTDPACDGVVDALAALREDQVSEQARKALAHIKSSPDLRRTLTKGLNLKSAKSDGWYHIPSETGATEGVPKMGLLAWNYSFPNTALVKGDLNKAGVIILVKDRPLEGSPGLEDVIRTGLVVAAQHDEPAGDEDQVEDEPGPEPRK